MLNKKFSQRMASIFIPKVMRDVDKASKAIKAELLKEAKGRLLDVGCGGGDWLKYFVKTSFITELEPNPYLIPKIQENVKKFREEHPEIQIEVMNKFVHELDKSKPYDVSF